LLKNQKAKIEQERNALYNTFAEMGSKLQQLANKSSKLQAEAGKKKDQLKQLKVQFHDILLQNEDIKAINQAHNNDYELIKSSDEEQAKQIEGLMRDSSVEDSKYQNDKAEKVEKINALKQELEKAKANLDNARVELHMEIAEYKGIVSAAEKTFAKHKNADAAFPFTPPADSSNRNSLPGMNNPASKTAERPKHKGNNKRRITTGADGKQESSNQTPERSRKRKVDQDTPPMQISDIDPLNQSVVVKNTSSEAINTGGWTLKNMTYQFSYQFPQITVEPGVTITFFKKGPKNSILPQKQDAKNIQAFLDNGGRDIQWPMEGFRAVIYDQNGQLVHDFQQKEKVKTPKQVKKSIMFG